MTIKSRKEINQIANQLDLEARPMDSSRKKIFLTWSVSFLLEISNRSFTRGSQDSNSIICFTSPLIYQRPRRYLLITCYNTHHSKQKQQRVVVLKVWNLGKMSQAKKWDTLTRGYEGSLAKANKLKLISAKHSLID